MTQTEAVTAVFTHEGWWAALYKDNSYHESCAMGTRFQEEHSMALRQQTKKWEHKEEDKKITQAHGPQTFFFSYSW